MAKQPARPAPGQAQTGQAAYPKDWGKLSKDQRMAWMKANRPDRLTGQVARAAAPPVAQPAPQPTRAAAPGGQQISGDQGRPLVQIDVGLYTVRVGMREPVQADPAELTDVIDKELRAWEEQCQTEDGNVEGNVEGDDEF